MTFIDDLDFGNLEDPNETPAERKEFCSRVVDNKPFIEEVLLRMTRIIGREYFGKSMSLEDLAQANGAIHFADILKDHLNLFENEHLQQMQPKEDEPNVISSGSELGL